MKYTPLDFARAFVDLYEMGDEKYRKQLSARFITVLAQYGMLRYSDKIVKKIHELLTTRNGGNIVRIEFARSPSDELLHAAAGFLSKKDLVETIANPTLGAGMRVTINEAKDFDMSLTSLLRDMFQVKSSL